MRDDELKWFVLHYERLTRHILQEMPQRADIRLDLDAQRKIIELPARAADSRPPESLAAFERLGSSPFPGDDCVIVQQLHGMLALHGCAAAASMPYCRLSHARPVIALALALSGHNFASLLPLSTTWMAVSELAAQPVAFYAAVFFLVNATYCCLIWELIQETKREEFSARVRRVQHT
jgi:hypothetical protein